MGDFFEMLLAGALLDVLSVRLVERFLFDKNVTYVTVPRKIIVIDSTLAIVPTNALISRLGEKMHKTMFKAYKKKVTTDIIIQIVN